MKRYIFMMAAVGIVLLLTGCGSAAPAPNGEGALFAANGPALTVVEKQPDQYTADPDGETAPPEQSPDLLTMNSEEEAGFALFYPLLNETQFRRLMAQDGVDFIPDRLVRCAEGGLAYYSSAAGDLVYCSADFASVKAVLRGERIGRIVDARWIDVDRLMFLQGDDSVQAVYLFRPVEETVEILYQPPEGRQILGIEIDENGQPVCILSALPEVNEVLPAPEDGGEESDTDPDSSGASNAKGWDGGLWDDEDSSEDDKTERGGETTGEDPAEAPAERVDLIVPAAEP